MNHLSLFSGIGGIDLAAEWAGMKTIAFCERDKFCQKILKKHWPDVRIFDDIRTIDIEWLKQQRIDIISGGFPCQPFSQAGKQLGEQDDRHLWPEYFRVIKELRPTWIVGENVVGIINLAIDNLLADLESISYAIRIFDIPACAIAASHERRRIFMVAHSHSNVIQGRLKKDKVLQREAAEQFSRLLPPQIWDEVSASRVYGTVNGIPNRMDRIKALGNAVVPQQIYPILKAIADLHT